MIGEKFGKWTVLSPGDRSNRYVRMLCRCDCGVERLVRRNMLKNGMSTSCGCAREYLRAVVLKPSRVDLTGQTFGRLRVLRDSGDRNSQRRVLWLCECSCGTEKKASTTALVKGIASSCGCFQKESAGLRKAINLTGKKFGLLTAVEPTGKDKSGYVLWRVSCECGSEKLVRSSALKGGEIISCGCAGTGSGLRGVAVKNKSAIRTNRRRARKLSAGGSFTAEDVERIYRLQRGRCAWCGVDLGPKFARDHRMPLARGGSNDSSNIELLCGGCNQRKHAKDPIVWANEMGRLL